MNLCIFEVNSFFMLSGHEEFLKNAGIKMPDMTRSMESRCFPDADPYVKSLMHNLRRSFQSISLVCNFSRIISWNWYTPWSIFKTYPVERINFQRTANPFIFKEEENLFIGFKWHAVMYGDFRVYVHHKCNHLDGRVKHKALNKRFLWFWLQWSNHVFC